MTGGRWVQQSDGNVREVFGISFPVRRITSIGLVIHISHRQMAIAERRTREQGEGQRLARWPFILLFVFFFWQGFRNDRSNAFPSERPRCKAKGEGCSGALTAEFPPLVRRRGSDALAIPAPTHKVSWRPAGVATGAAPGDRPESKLGATILDRR